MVPSYGTFDTAARLTGFSTSYLWREHLEYSVLHSVFCQGFGSRYEGIGSWKRWT